MKRFSTAVIAAVVLAGSLCLLVPTSAVADAPIQGNGKCFVDGEHPCGPCEEWKRNCRKFVCIPIPGCVPEGGEPTPQG